MGISDEVEKSKSGLIFVNFLKIILITFITYIIMVFISHFSVYNSSESYKIADSFSAMWFESDVPAQYFVIFGIHIIIVVILALLVNLLSLKFKKK